MSKIKANVPLAYKQGAKADRMRMMNAFFIYSGYVLYKYHNFTEKELQEYVNKMAEFFAAEKHNDTLIDETTAWAEAHGFMERVRRWPNG